MDDALFEIPEPSDYFAGIGHETLPTPRDLLLFVRGDKRSLQQKALQHRSHHRFVLAFNFETAGQVQVDQLCLAFAPGQALLIHPYQFHHYSQLEHDQLRWLFCTFELEPRSYLESLRNRVVDLSPATIRALEQLLRQWHRKGSGAQAGQLQASLLQLLLSLMQDRYTCASDLPPEPEDDLLRRVNRLLMASRGQSITVKDLAGALQLSESHLRKRFHQLAGVPLGSYVRNYRQNRAMALLRTTNLSIAEVAEEAGFGSPQAFSRVFKESTGMTARDYRNHRSRTAPPLRLPSTESH